MAEPLILRMMSQRRTWVCLFVLVYVIVTFTCWNFLQSIISWYKSSSSSSASSGWPALYALVVAGATFGMLSMVVAFALILPAILVIWSPVVFLLAFFGKPRRALVVEGRKITTEIVGFVFKILLKEGNAVAAICALLASDTLFRHKTDASPRFKS